MPGRRILVAILLFTLMAAGCSELDPQLQTDAVNLGRTAAAEAGRFAQTEAAQLKETAQVVVGTQAVGLKETSEARIATESARLLETRIPATAPPPQGEGIVTYTVIKGDNLSKIAERFSKSVETLVALNKERYPSLVTNPRYVEVGWVLIVSSTAASTPTPVPPPAPTPWSTTPGCDVSSVYWLASPIHCQESVIDVVSHIGLSLGCVALDENPLGYYMTHTIYKGWILTNANGVMSYGWFVDKEKNLVVIGPAIVLEKSTLVECGIPGNP